MENEWRKKEAERIDALKLYNVLDTGPDEALDSLVRAAAAICEVPIALVSLVDTSRQWFKASVGLAVSETPREHSFCSHAIEQPDSLMVVEDASTELRFKSNPLGTGSPNIRFSSGQPLISPEGHALGTLCVIDDKPRRLNQSQVKALTHLADAVVELLGRHEQSMFAAINSAVEQSLQHGITITDPSQPDNPMVYCNKAFERLTGYNQDELIGRNCRFLQGESTDPASIAILRDAITQQHQVTVVLRNYRKNGTAFWAEITVSPIVDREGLTTHFIGIQKDVTERYKTEAALSQSRALIDSAPDAIIVSNRDGGIVLANSQTVKIFGYSQQELSRLTIDKLIAERFREPYSMGREKYFDQLEFRNSSFEVKLAGLTKDNEEIPVDARISPVETDQGVLVSTYMRNVSNKLEAEAALLKSEERYRDLFENSSDLIQTVYPDGTFSYVNPAWLKAFGYSQDEVTTLSIVDMVYPDNIDHCRKLIDRVVAGESIAHVEMVFATKSGDPVYLEGSVSTGVIDGKVTAIRTIFRDVTERKETEELLVLSKEFAESATAAKSRFLAAASHDLRQPLQSASMYLATLARQLDKSDSAEELCDMAAKSLAVMGRLLDALLDITQLDTGAIAPERKNVAIRKILDSIVISTQQQAERKGLKFSCEYQDNVVYTDPVLLERIVENFVGNAIRYTEQGEIKLTCSVNENQVLIAVSDTGVGIPLDKRDEVFEEYYQLGNDTRDRNRGLGLGLSIVKRIARLLDYPLDVSSEFGQGSTFSVTVPLGETISIDVPEPQVSETQKVCKPIILLVDDDESVLKSTERLLTTYDMVVHSAVNGDDALAMIAGGLDPDFLISDFRLPQYDGIELIERIRVKLSRTIATVMMTGDTSTPRIKQAQLANFTVLNKPVDVPLLLRLIADSVK
jgi:PAS domain S-box-containing protein